MVVKEDGSKWACQSCLKGHRVSGCTHTDRELTLVPKKGRPVTQCHHCRLERKKRSAHVSCDCGTEKPHHAKEKCIHLREAEERAKVGSHDDSHIERDPAHLAAVAEEQGCCCHHGGQCTCAILKRDTGESSSQPHGPAVKPRLEKLGSDGAITVFTNGHHKPVHRKNHAAHECGMPYKLPMQRSHTEHNVSVAARRSVDSLALDSNMFYQPSDYNPQTSAPFNTERRRSKSEQPSPKILPVSQTCNGGLGNAKLTSIDFSTLSQTQTNQSVQSATSETFSFPSFDQMSGVTDGSNDPWSALPSTDSTGIPNNNPFGVWPTPIDGSNLAQPALTAASSGTTSEIDDIPPTDDIYGLSMPSIQEDSGDFTTANMPTGNTPQANRRSLPPNFFGNADLTMAGFQADWQMAVNDFDATIEDKAQSQQSTQAMSFDETWQMPAMRPITSAPQRALGGLPVGARPQSRSVGPASAPSDDIIKQLFPEIEINGNIFGQTGSPQLTNASTDTIMGESRSINATSAPIDFSQMDTNMGFTTQSWTDGSISLPNDTFTTPYNLEDDFSNPDFSTSWSQ